MAKKTKFILISFLCAITCLTSTLITYSISNGEKGYAYNSVSEVVMEKDSLRVLYQSNATEKKFMASTTKILTAIVVIENCNMSDIITINKQTTGIEGSSIYLEPGEKLSVKDLLYGLMLRSGNDCAETLAVHCSGSISEFAKLMNETAKRIGAFNSNFVNPHGLHDDNHYTTAYDLALISCYAMKNQTFREIVSTKSIDIPFTTKNTIRRLINKNKMLNDYEGANGIKTGYTKKAGRCLVSSCKRGNLELICVVLNCPPMFERSKQLLNDCFMKFKSYKILDSNNIIDFIEVKDKSEKIPIEIKNDVYLPLTDNEFANLEIIYDYPKILDKNYEKGKEIGLISIYSQNNLIFSEKIYTIL